MKITTAVPFIRFEDAEDQFLPEGPQTVRLDGRDALAWVNIQTGADARRGAVHVRYWDDGEMGLWNLSGRPGFLLPTDKPGTLFIGLDKELGTLELETNTFRSLARIADISPRTIINDGELMPGGKGIVFGTKDLQFSDPIAKLYFFALTDGHITTWADRQTCSNGKVFTRDHIGPVLYDIDTPTKKVARYRTEPGSRNARFDGTVIDTAHIPGFPDGMCDCGDGTVIIAFYNPEPVEFGRAVRWNPATGEALEEWHTPGSPRVTCPCLVQRPDGVKLILTTATETMPGTDREKCPEAGNIFIASTSLATCPAREVVRLSA